MWSLSWLTGLLVSDFSLVYNFHIVRDYSIYIFLWLFLHWYLAIALYLVTFRTTIPELHHWLSAFFQRAVTHDNITSQKTSLQCITTMRMQFNRGIWENIHTVATRFNSLFVFDFWFHYRHAPKTVNVQF